MLFPRWVLIASDGPAAAAVLAAVVLMRPVSGWWVWCLAAALGLPLAVRRCWPAPVLATVVLAAAAAIGTGVGTEVAVYPVAFALYPVALSSARAAGWGLAGALGGVLVPGLADALTAGLPLHPPRDTMESFSTAPVTTAGYSAVVIVGGWAVARALRVRRRQAAEIAELRAARAVAEERLRIARDIHDVVGHNLSLIAMRAAVANHLDADREAALRTIEQVSRAALDDVRVVLTGLRAPDGARAPDGDSSHAPDGDSSHAPDGAGPRASGGGGDDPQSTAGLDGLVEQARAAGVDVTIERADLSAVPAGVRVAAYRVLQEALTNVRRHARATRCRVTVAVAGDALTLSVVNDGAAPGGVRPPGNGISGMRERVAMHGGSLSTGPEPAGGFAVRATLPITA